MQQTVALIGGGHNGLITACYLAKAGYAVTVYEQAPQVGGLCLNTEIWPGYTTSLIANWYGMLCPEIITDLSLHLELILDDTTALALTRNGEYLSSTANTVNGLTESDHAALARYDADFAAITKVLRTYFLHPAPTRAAFLKDLEALNLPLPPEQMMSASLVELSAHYTQNPQARLLLQDSFQHPNHPGTGYSHAFMGIPYAHAAEGTKWCYLKGGMGKITEQLLARATTLGVTIRTSTPVQHITTEGAAVTSLTLASGEIVTTNIYISGTDYPTTCRLMGQPAPRTNAHAYTTIPIHIKLKQLPTFTTMADNNLPPASTINLMPPFEATATASPTDVAAPTFHNHIISVSIPTVIDPSRAPAGQHLMMLGIEHATQSYSASGWTDADKQTFFKLICDEVSAYAPNFTSCIEDWHIVTPQDLRTHHGLTGMHCFHGDLTWEFAMDARLPGLGAGPHTHLDNFYLCGAAIHPGGTVNGAPGYRCAHAILNPLN